MAGPVKKTPDRILSQEHRTRIGHAVHKNWPCCAGSMDDMDGGKWCQQIIRPFFWGASCCAPQKIGARNLNFTHKDMSYIELPSGHLLEFANLKPWPSSK